MGKNSSIYVQYLILVICSLLGGAFYTHCQTPANASEAQSNIYARKITLVDAKNRPVIVLSVDDEGQGTIRISNQHGDRLVEMRGHAEGSVGAILFSEEKYPAFASVNAFGLRVQNNLNEKSEYRADALLIYKGDKPNYANWLKIDKSNLMLGYHHKTLWSAP